MGRKKGRTIPDSLTLFITCPCGMTRRIEGASQNDIEGAKHTARCAGWHYPRLSPEPPVHGYVQLEGVCNECFEMDDA